MNRRITLNAILLLCLFGQGCEKQSLSGPVASPPNESASTAVAAEVAKAWRDLASKDDAQLRAALAEIASMEPSALRNLRYSTDPSGGDGFRLGPEFIPMIASFREFATRVLVVLEQDKVTDRAKTLAALDHLWAGLMRSGDAMPGKQPEEKFTAWSIVATWRLWVHSELEKLGTEGSSFTSKEVRDQLQRLQRQLGRIAPPEQVP